MSEPICKVADIIYVRFELKEFEAQKKYLNHFGMMLAHEDDNSIFLEEPEHLHIYMLQLKVMKTNILDPVSYTHLTLPTTPYV